MIAFRHGVASADPLPHGVLLWTRCTTDAREPVEVRWWLGPSADPAEATTVGTVMASADADFTVQIDVDGLEPATAYWYGFAASDVSSPTGRTRTAPAPGHPVEHLRLGLVSCAYWSCGFFNAYGNLAARDLDLVIHVGDYIYENDIVGRSRRAVRAHVPPGPVATLDGYRARYAQYRTDPDLQALHARHPVVAVWDDHEFAGGAWRDGASDHREARHGPWADRRAAAAQAYSEWVPMRPSVPGAVFRTVHLGKLGDLVLLDTRLAGRDLPAAEAHRAVWTVSDGTRAMLGEKQWRWLEGEVAGSTARWLLVGNQVMMAPLRLLGVGRGVGVNPGQWDGYPAERDRFYDLLRGARWASNVAVLSGDLHSSWASELPVGAEFVGPSVTTDSFARTVLPPVPGATALARRLFLSQNRHVRLADLDHHGYVVVDVTAERLQADWWHVGTITRRDRGERWGGGRMLENGKLGLRKAEGPASLSS